MDSTLEVFLVSGRHDRNRNEPDDVKARIVAETLLPGALPVETFKVSQRIRDMSR
ncbi:hypothetical protein D3C80_249340 [compost metagenome]